MDEELVVDVADDSRRTTVTVQGDIDLDTVGQLDRVLRDLDSAYVVLNLAGVTFCDSRALECLVRNKVAYRDSHRRLDLAEESPTVQRLLELTGMTRFFEDD